MRFVDPTGQTAEERAAALRKAREYVDSNPHKDPAQHSESHRKGGPGQSSDCSGMVANCAAAAGVPNLDDGTHHRATLNINENSRPVAASDVQPGNLATFKTGEDSYHVGMVTSVTRNKNGELTEFTMDHNSSSYGPESRSVKMKGDLYWGKVLTGFRAWDQPDPTPVAVTPSAPRQFRYVPEKVMP
jgi:cell wall-associated NlpC family hydrolase